MMKEEELKFDISLALQKVPEQREWSTAVLVNGKSIPKCLRGGSLFRQSPGGGYKFNSHVKDQEWSLLHWFDGLSMVHEFKFDQDGATVTYRNRSVSQAFEKGARARGEFLSFGPKRLVNKKTDGDDNSINSTNWIAENTQKLLNLGSRLGMYLFLGDGMNNATLGTNLNVTITPAHFSRGKRGKLSLPHQANEPKIVLGTDANVLQALRIKDLEPEQQFTFGAYCKSDGKKTTTNSMSDFSSDELAKALNRGMLSASHGQFDPETGEYFNFTIELGPLNDATLHLFSIDAEGITRKLSSIWMSKASYIHSFSITRSYVLIMAYPYCYNSVGMLYHGCVKDALAFEASGKTRLYIIPRQDPLVGRFIDLPPLFSFHHINAFDLEQANTHSLVTEITIYLVAYKDNKIVQDLMIENLTRPDGSVSQSFLLRVKVQFDPNSIASEDGNLKDLKSTSFSIESCCIEGETVQWLKGFESFSDYDKRSFVSLELPAINENFQMKGQSRFVWAVGTDGGVFSRDLVKIDLSTQDPIKRWRIEGHFPGEPIFVPNEALLEEDDGFILSVVFDSREKYSYLIILDAKSMEETGKLILSGERKVIVPFGFHGHFVK